MQNNVCPGKKSTLGDDLLAWVERQHARIITGLVILVVLAGMVYSLSLSNVLRYKDERDYYRLATNLVTYYSYSLNGQQASLYRPPGYPFLLAPFIFLGVKIVFLRLLNFLTLAGCFWLIYRILKEQISPRAGVLGALLALCYPITFYTAGTLYPQIPGACLFLLIIYLLVARPAWKWSWPLAGGLLGLLILMLPTFLFTLGIFFVWAWQSGRWERLKRYLLMVAVACLVIAPWMIRNYVVFGVFSISANSSHMLLLGNSENTTPNAGPNADIRRYSMVADSLHLNDAQRAAYYQTQALEWIRQHKVQAAKLFILKALSYFNYRNDLYTRSESSTAADVIMLLTWGPLLLLFIWRLFHVQAVRLSQIDWLLIALYVSSALVHAVFFTRIRYRIPFDFLLIMVVAGYLNRIIDRRLTRPAMVK